MSPTRNEIQVWTPKEYESALVRRGDRLTQLLAGSDIAVPKFIGMTVQAIARDPKLTAPDVDKESLLLAVLTVAEMGLVPSGAFGGAYLVPFQDRQTRTKKVQPIIDWRAFIKMALQSGQIRAAWAHVVYEGDEFQYRYGDDPRLLHEPGTQREKILYAYAVARLLDGTTTFEVMPVADIEAIRKAARGSDSGPWVDNYPEMCRKTAVRRLFKYLPVAVSPQLAAALEAEDRWEDLGRAEPVQPRALTSRQRRLLEAAGAEPAAAAPETDSKAPEAPSLTDSIGDEEPAADSVSEDAEREAAEPDEGLPA